MDLLGSLVSSLQIAASKDHGRTLSRESFYSCLTDARVASRDDRDLPFHWQRLRAEQVWVSGVADTMALAVVVVTTCG